MTLGTVTPQNLLNSTTKYHFEKETHRVSDRSTPIVVSLEAADFIPKHAQFYMQQNLSLPKRRGKVIRIWIYSWLSVSQMPEKPVQVF